MGIDVPRRRSLAMRLYLWSHGECRVPMIGWPVAKLLHWTSKVLTASDIDPYACIHATVYMSHATGVVVGETATVDELTTIMPGVVLGEQEFMGGKRHADIGASVMIATGAKVLGPVTVEDDAVMDVNAVMIKDIPPGAKAVGVPGW